VRQLRSTSNDLKRQGRRLEAAGRQFDRENHRTQSRLRQLPRSQSHVSISERTFLDSVAEYVAADPIERENDVFLSHATADLALAHALHDELAVLGADVWIDDFSIRLDGMEVRAGAPLTCDRGLPTGTGPGW